MRQSKVGSRCCSGFARQPWRLWLEFQTRGLNRLHRREGFWCSNHPVARCRVSAAVRLARRVFGGRRRREPSAPGPGRVRGAARRAGPQGRACDDRDLQEQLAGVPRPGCRRPCAERQSPRDQSPERLGHVGQLLRSQRRRSNPRRLRLKQPPPRRGGPLIYSPVSGFSTVCEARNAQRRAHVSVHGPGRLLSTHRRAWR